MFFLKKNTQKSYHKPIASDKDAILFQQKDTQNKYLIFKLMIFNQHAFFFRRTET
jgi:hypothetical protein